MARAFINRPLILLADEPTGNLDPATSVGIMRILDRINRTGTTVVMATHDHAIVDAMRRRVVELERGRVVRDEHRGVYETLEQPPSRPTAVVGTDAATVTDGTADVELEVDAATDADAEEPAGPEPEPAPSAEAAPSEVEESP